MDPNVFDKLRRYKGVSHFRRAAMNILVKISTEEQMHLMTEQFKTIDRDNSGMIRAVELKKYIQAQHLGVSDKELKEMMEELNYTGDGKINYSEFLAATIEIKTFFNDAKLRTVFSMFDTDGEGRISESDMHFAFQKLG